MKRALTYEEFLKQVKKTAMNLSQYDGAEERVDAALEENESICKEHFNAAVAAFEKHKEHYIKNDHAEWRFVNEADAAGYVISMLA